MRAPVDLTPASPASVRRRFLSWDTPLLPQAVALLSESWRGDGPLNLADVLVIVPTRQSGRRLREALAEHAARRNAAVLPPRVLLPESLVAPQDPTGVATRLESLLAWADVFMALAPGDSREVVPVEPPLRNFAWALRLAEEFVRLQRTLAEAGLRLGDVVRRAGAGFPEQDRWRQIGELEWQYAQRLARAGLRDPTAARIDQAKTPVAPLGVRRIVMLGTPDPQPLALQALAALAATIPVDVVIHAPVAEAEAFDSWGRPRSAVWSARTLEIPGFEQHVHLCADPEVQAIEVAALAARYPTPEGVLAVGVADPEVIPTLESELRQVSVTVFNPEGRARRGNQLDQLLQSCARLARDEAFGTVETLARCPDFLEFLGRRLGSGFSAARFLRDLDKLHQRHLPDTLADALRRTAQGESMSAGLAPAARDARAAWAELDRALAVVAELHEMLATGEFPENATTALAAIFGGRKFDLGRTDDARAAEAAGSWGEVLRDAMRARAEFSGVATADWWELAIRLYGESVEYGDKLAGALELQGWLELLWEDAPHLVVAGLNDGCVPESIVGHPFLPESLRERLGLKTNAERFARDAYLLQAIATARRGTGRLDLLFGKTSAVGEPLRSSRLLLRCRDDELPQRVRQLFRPAESGRTTLPWRRAWRLAPRNVAPPERLAVTALRAWLECPFRFYLSRVFRMEAVDPAKTELDVFDFGTLCHSALEAMGAELALRNETKPEVLRDFLLTRLEAEAARRFGSALSLPLIVQLDAARQRLARAAEIQARTRADGWLIAQVERPFELPVGGLVITGKIDRIDRHESTGALRVLDYKTSDRPVDPAHAHFRSLRRAEVAPEFARFVQEGKEYVWTDLQLPLYLRALAADHTLGSNGAAGSGATSCECGYFNLPKSVGETGIRPWPEYTRELEAAAWRCATGLARVIRDGMFWPPNETIRPERDDFAALFHHGVAESVLWNGKSLVGDGTGGTEVGS